MSDFIDRNFAREVGFLKELVRVPSANPPGDCAVHAAKAAELLGINRNTLRKRIRELGIPLPGKADETPEEPQ